MAYGLIQLFTGPEDSKINNTFNYVQVVCKIFCFCSCLVLLFVVCL